MSDETLREKLDKIYSYECTVNYSEGTVRISGSGWKQILTAIEEGITGCGVCAGLGVSNPSDFREDKPMLVKGLCPNCGGKGWLMRH